MPYLACAKCDNCQAVVTRPRHRLFRGKYVFCSRRCGLKYTHAKAVQTIRDIKKAKQIQKPCKQCEIIFVRPPSRGTEQFCSRKCLSDYWHKHPEETPNWRGGHGTRHGHNWKKQRKKALFLAKGHCAKCHITEKRSGFSLEVNHIQPARLFAGDWEKANDLTNLIILCKSCHARATREKLFFNLKLL